MEQPVCVVGLSWVDGTCVLKTFSSVVAYRAGGVLVGRKGQWTRPTAPCVVSGGTGPQLPSATTALVACPSPIEATRVCLHRRGKNVLKFSVTLKVSQFSCQRLFFSGFLCWCFSSLMITQRQGSVSPLFFFSFIPPCALFWSESLVLRLAYRLSSAMGKYGYREVQ